MATFQGKEEVELFRAMTVRAGLKLFADTGMRPNRAWTPANMMRAAAEITGKKFKARDYAGAIAALDVWIDHASATKQFYVVFKRDSVFDIPVMERTFERALNVVLFAFGFDRKDVIVCDPRMWGLE